VIKKFWFDSMHFSTRARQVLMNIVEVRREYGNDPGVRDTETIRSKEQLVAMLKRGDAPKYRGLGKTVEAELIWRCGLIRKQPVCECCGQSVGPATVEEVSG